MARDLRVLIEWESVLHRMLDCTQRFPKSVRFSFVQRIDTLVLDIAQTIVKAQYAPTEDQPVHLQILNSQLAQLRLLWRLSADRKYLSMGLLREFIEALDGIGFQVHAWLKVVNVEMDPDFTHKAD